MQAHDVVHALRGMVYLRGNGLPNAELRGDNVVSVISNLMSRPGTRYVKSLSDSIRHASLDFEIEIFIIKSLIDELYHEPARSFLEFHSKPSLSRMHIVVLHSLSYRYYCTVSYGHLGYDVLAQSPGVGCLVFPSAISLLCWTCTYEPIEAISTIPRLVLSGITYNNYGVRMSNQSRCREG